LKEKARREGEGGEAREKKNLSEKEEGQERKG